MAQDERYDSWYTNEYNLPVKVDATIGFRRRGPFRGFRTDTVVRALPLVDGGRHQEIILSDDNTITNTYDYNGLKVPQQHHEYWKDNAREIVTNATKKPTIMQRIKNAVGFKQEGGTLQQGALVKEKVKQLIKLRKDPLKGLQAMLILGEFMQLNPELFETIVLELAQEDLDVAEFVQELQQAAQSAQGTPAAAKGAKLNYVKELKGICPEGYLATGGKCKPCEAKMKAKGGDLDPVKSFKANRKNKK